MTWIKFIWITRGPKMTKFGFIIHRKCVTFMIIYQGSLRCKKVKFFHKVIANMARSSSTAVLLKNIHQERWLSQEMPHSPILICVKISLLGKNQSFIFPFNMNHFLYLPSSMGNRFSKINWNLLSSWLLLKKCLIVTPNHENAHAMSKDLKEHHLQKIIHSL